MRPRKEAAGAQATISLFGAALTGVEFPWLYSSPWSSTFEMKQANPSADCKVTWTVGNHPGPMAVQLEPLGASLCIVVIDGNGNATLNKMMGKSIYAYYSDCALSIIASYGLVFVTFDKKGRSLTTNRSPHRLDDYFELGLLQM